MNFSEHKRETYSVCWNPVTKDTFVSSSWDGTVKIVCNSFFGCSGILYANCMQWSPTRKHSLKTLPIGNCAYSTSFSPSNPSIISVVSSDSHIRIFDLRTPVSAKYHLTGMVPVHLPPAQAGRVPAEPAGVPAEVLTHDWNKYNNTVIATGGVDRMLRTFDIRNPIGGPISVLQGHEYAIRRLAWSPHASDLLLSGSYDMTVRLWNDGSSIPPDPTLPVRPGMQLGIMNRHTEFVMGVDWCLFGAAGWVASAGWDERVLLWDANMLLQHH